MSICVKCGNNFLQQKRGERYCQICRNETMTCQICGKEFSAFRRKKTVCSHKCAMKLCTLEGKNAFSNRQLIEKAMIAKYGVKNPMQVKEILQKSVSKHDYKEITKKASKTMLDKYGYSHALQIPDSKKKLEETILKSGTSGRFGTKEHNNAMLEKYGVIVPYKNEKIKNKGIQTLLDKYGVRSPMQLGSVKEKVKKTCLENFGVPTNLLLCTKNRFRISKVNRRIAEFLNITEFEYRIGSRSFDLKKGNILIEINPTATHNSTKTIFNEIKEKDYHLNRTKVARENNFDLIHIWDWDDLEKIKVILEEKQSIYARECEIGEVSKLDADDFLNRFHLQGSCAGNRVNVGLKYKNELVSLMSFGDSRYSKIPIELLRYCNSNYKIIGGSEKLFKYFINNYKPESIVSYCDNSKFNGDVYRKLNFVLKNTGEPSCHWVRGPKHYTDNLLRKLGADKLIGTSYGKGSNNEEIMLHEGFVKMYDCGQSTYIWQKEKTS